MFIESQPIFAKEIEIFSYRNKLDECMGLIGIHYLDSQSFPIVECKSPKQIQEKLSSLFGKVNEFQALKLEVELSSLVLDEHSWIKGFLTKFKLFLSQLRGCGKIKIDEECIFVILSRLNGPFKGILWMHLDQRLKCSCLIFSVRILTNHNLIFLNQMFFLYIRINLLRLKSPKVSRKLSANKILILLKLVSLAPTLNIIQSSQLYRFYGFENFSSSSFIAHAHSLSRL